MRLRRGFTLTEMLVVILIIAILAAIAMNAYDNYLARSKVWAAKADLTALSLNLENELQRNLVYGTHKFNSAQEINQAYRGWHPSQKSSFTYALDSEPTRYTLTAMGESGSLSSCVLTLQSDTTRSMDGNCAFASAW